MKKAIIQAIIEFINSITKLIKVKSIISLITTLVFAILSLKGIIPKEDFIKIFLIIIGFYFGTQSAKGE